MGCKSTKVETTTKKAFNDNKNKSNIKYNEKQKSNGKAKKESNNDKNNILNNSLNINQIGEFDRYYEAKLFESQLN